MEIREGDLFDLPLIVEKAKIFNELAKDAYGKYMSYDPASVTKTITSAVKNGGKYWVLWDDNDEFAGIILGGLIRNAYNASEIIATCGFVAVMPEHQRSQWGSKLMGKFEGWAKDCGAGAVRYSGYDKKWMRTMKRHGYTQTQVTFMKEI